MKHRLKHFFYSAGWKRFERLWDAAIRLQQLNGMRPLLEAVLAPVTDVEERGEELPVRDERETQAAI